jgi:hypothetical protein
MRRARIAFITSLFVFAVAVSFTASTYTQTTRDKFVISAKAGGVNAVTGRATVRSHGNTEWQQLTIKEDLETGDVVRTGLDGRVEMLLNPGSYMRIGENSEFELADNSLDNLQVRLIRGTAIVEATGADDTELLINIVTPHTKLAIVRRGLYRLNVVPGDGTELIVRKGRVMLDDSHTKVKGGNKVVFSSHSFSIAKLEQTDKNKFDDLESWSKQRAETVAKANQKIRGRDMTLLMASMDPRWDRFSPAYRGVWMFNAGYNCYTFVPFFMGWGSPYGSSYSRSFFGGYYDPSIYYGTSRGYPGNNSSGSSTRTSTSTSTSTPANISPPPSPSTVQEPRSYPSRIGGKSEMP